jgi:hypothetical protein
MSTVLHAPGVVLTLGWFLVFGTALAETGPQQPEGTTLAIITTLEEPCPEATLYEMRLELAEILDPVGLRLVWRSVREDLTGKTSNYVVSVRFQGNCVIEEPPGGPIASEELGLTYITDGEVTPYCAVRCDAVRGLARPLLFREGRGRASALLGRALGRVVAHEIYHVLAMTRIHGRRGVAKRSLTAEDLILGSLRFGDAEMTTLRNRTRVVSLADRAPGAFLRGCLGK